MGVPNINDILKTSRRYAAATSNEQLYSSASDREKNSNSNYNINTNANPKLLTISITLTLIY